MKHERALAITAFVIVCVVWGTTYLGIRVAVETIPPLLLTAMRFVTAGLVMLAIARMRGERIPTHPATLANLVLVGFLMVGVGNLAVVWAEQWVPSGLAALFVATAPFWMALIELFRSGGERLNARGAIGMLIGFAGVAMLVTPKGAGGSYDVHFVVGALVMQLGSLAWQLGSVRGKYYLKDVPLLASASLQMLFGGIIVGIVGLLIGEPASLSFTPRTTFALAYLTIFGSIIAYSAYVYALAHMRTSQSSLYAYVNPVVAVILGWLILHEELTWLSVVAMCVILGGVALVQTTGRAKAVIPSREDGEESGGESSPRPDSSRSAALGMTCIECGDGNGQDEKIDHHQRHHHRGGASPRRATETASHGQQAGRRRALHVAGMFELSARGRASRRVVARSEDHSARLPCRLLGSPRMARSVFVTAVDGAAVGVRALDESRQRVHAAGGRRRSAGARRLRPPCVV